MAKFYGTIGYQNQVETRPGVWEEEIVERNYYGDYINSTRKNQSSEHLNDDINISSQISIIADPFAKENLYSMRYVKDFGTKWKILSVEVQQYPRLILTVGGIYNEQRTNW